MKNSCVQWVTKELAIVLPYLFYSDLQYNLRQGWRHAFNGYCDYCSWKKLNNRLQCRSSLRCCDQSVDVYQNCLEQSQKHNGAYDHYSYMETKLNIGDILLLRLSHEKKMGPKSLFLPFLRHITQTQIDIIIDISFKHRKVKFYCNKKKSNSSQSTCLRSYTLSNLNFL